MARNLLTGLISETGSHNGSQTGLELIALLSQLPKYGDYGDATTKLEKGFLVDKLCPVE